MNTPPWLPRCFMLATIVLACATTAADDTAPPASVSPLPLAADTEFSDSDSDMRDMVGEALRKLALDRNRDGLKFLASKDYPRALERFQQAFELLPQDAEICGNLGYIYQLLGNAEEAEVHYRTALSIDPSRLATYLNLADLLSVKGETAQRLAEAADLLGTARELKGNKARIILRQARVAALRGDFAEAERFYLDLGASKGTSSKTFLEIGDFYRDFGYADKALVWYRRVDDEELGKLAAARIFELEAEREARKLGWSQRVDVVGSRPRALATRGQLAANQGNVEEGERLLLDALSLAPTFASARADLGDLYKRTNRLTDAEMAYLQALACEPGSPEVSARLGELYMSQGRGAEAALLLTRALEARPDWHALHLTLAKALRTAGDLRAALARVDRYLALAAEGQQQREALALKAAISRLLPGSRGQAGIAESLATMERARTLDSDVANALAKVKLHLAEDRPDAAMAVLRLLPAGKRGKGVLNLEGRILMSGGRMDEAAATFLESLSADPNQVEVHEQLGAINDSLGKTETAMEHFARAETLGSQAASYHLARLAWPQDAERPGAWFRDMWRLHSLYQSRRRVQGFLGSGTASLYIADAKSLAARLDQRLYTIVAIWMGLVILTFYLVTLLMWRLRGGSTLAELVTRHPEAGPQVLRVMAAIRHEVLKHNTIMLGGLADAVERQDPELGDKAVHLATVLWGHGDKASGVSARLENYSRELTKIGLTHGVRLNLRHKDPALTTLHRGFDRLEHAKASLQRANRLGPRARARLLHDLREAFELLNVRGYEAVRALLDQLRMLDVDLQMLEALGERVRSEPGFQGQNIAPLLIHIDTELPHRVFVARRDFEDIIANLLRNALQSSLAEPETPTQIGLSLDINRNAITGIETLELAVHDRSKDALTTEMIRGRYIEQGLGLTADLVSRYEGSIDVVAGPASWSKSVRVRLPLAPIADDTPQSQT